jgi:hypothetical protein
LNNLYAKVDLIVDVSERVNNKTELQTLSIQNIEHEIDRIKEINQQMSYNLNSNDIHSIKKFRPKIWIRESFVDFADSFMVTYQKQQLKNSHEHLEDAYEIIKETLKYSSLEPVDIKLGVTPFNSKVHIGRSTVSNADMPDKVIASVIRNGFYQSGGKSFYRQPEVIINKQR